MGRSSFFGATSAGAASVVPDADLTGRLAIVVGSAGKDAIINQDVAAGLVSRKLSTLILAVSDVASGEQARKRLLDAHPGAYCRVEVWQLDLGSFPSVKSFGQRMNSLARLDILVMGPGISITKRVESTDGYELSLQVNVLSSGLLCLLALPLMKRTAGLPGQTCKPHLVLSANERYSASTSKEWNESDFIIVTLNDKNAFRGKEQFAITQLLTVCITRELSSLKITRPINVSCAVAPEQRTGALLKVLPPFLRSWQGAANLGNGANSHLFAALIDSPPAALWCRGREVEPSKKLLLSTNGQEMQKKVWAELCAIWREQSNEAAAALM